MNIVSSLLYKMEKLLDYLDYDYMTCFSVDSLGNFRTWSSSSKVAMTITNNSTQTRSDEIVNGVLYAEDIFPEYFALYSKDREQLSPHETLILSAILKYFKDLKVELAGKANLSPKTCQIIFVPPPLADWDVCALRALFWETGWISSRKDDDSQFILVPFIEAHLNVLHMTRTIRNPLEREKKKHMLLWMESIGGKTTYTSICFQMQCAKELIVLSKSLASSDFLLVPSVLSSTSICLPNIEQAVLADRDAKMSNFLTRREMRHNVDMGPRIVESVNNVQRYARAVCDSMKESLETTLIKYRTSRNAPDGIHNTLLSHNIGREASHIAEALLEAHIMKPDDLLVDVRFMYELQNGALQRPLKIRQIVSTILPPVIQNQEESAKVVLHDRQEDGNVFLPVNSFYLQANIGERQIEFTLNKVVRKPSPKTPVELFTAQERIVEMDDILTVASEILWSHYQLLESEGCLSTFISCCREHKDIELSLGHYQRFTASMGKLINTWFRNKSVLSCKELDAEQLISIGKRCACALKTTHRMLLETGLKPAISSIAEIIVGNTLSNDMFGLFALSAVFVKGCVNLIDNVYCADRLEHHLKERIRRILQTHRRKLTAILVNQVNEASMKQYISKGNYTQISSSTYSISFEVLTCRRSLSIGLLESHLFAYKYLPDTYFHSRERDGSYLFKSKDTILRKDERLPSTGAKKILFLPSCSTAYINVNIASAIQSNTNDIPLYSISIYPESRDCCIAITVSPLHHASKLHIGFSKMWISPGVLEIEEPDSIDIPERLFLKRNS